MAKEVALAILGVAVAYLLAGLLFAILFHPGDPYASFYDRVVVDGWKEIQCYLSDRRSCCGWISVSSCPLSKGITAAGFAFALTIVPVTVIIWLVRRFSWPRPLSEFLTGGLLGAAAGWLSAQIPHSDGTYPDVILLPFIIPGVIAGFAYWLISGRN